MNKQQLQCFACVAEYLNFTKVSEELFLTVSTVTHHIQSLESELNTKLFIRTTRAVQLIEAGAAFYPDAREILTRLELSKKQIQTVLSFFILAVSVIQRRNYKYRDPITLCPSTISIPMLAVKRKLRWISICSMVECLVYFRWRTKRIKKPISPIYTKNSM